MMMMVNVQQDQQLQVIRAALQSIDTIADCFETSGHCKFFFALTS